MAAPTRRQLAEPRKRTAAKSRRARAGKPAVGEIPIDRTLGPLVIRWIERKLVYGPGDVQGQRIELDDEKARFLWRAYEIDERGRRVIRRAALSHPKGWAKSELAAFIAAAEALGPTRFAGWDHDGRPLGETVRSPKVLLAATEEGQANNVYGPLYFMLSEGPIAATPGLDVGLTRTYLPHGGVIRPVTAKATSKEGGLETFCAFGETHLWTTPELHRLAATLRRNLGKRKGAEGWSLEETTMYAPGEESVAELTHRYAQAIEEGRISDPSFLFDHRQGPTEFDFADDDALRDALVVAYGDAARHMDFERMIAEARDPDTLESDFRRFFLNQPWTRENAWIRRALWMARADPERTVETLPEQTTIVLGFDGSDNDDATALVGCTIEEDPHLFVVGVWERPVGPDAVGWKVPRDEVDDRVAWAMEHFDVRELRADPPHWRKEIETWADLYSDDVVISEFRTYIRRFMGEACARLKSDVIHGRVTHDGNLALARHIANAITKPFGEFSYITKETKHSKRKIDLATASVIAHSGAVVRRHDATSVYEEREPILL